VIASFDGRLLDPAAVYELVVLEEKKEIARTGVALSKLR
jgi:hypothetical protein